MALPSFSVEVEKRNVMQNNEYRKQQQEATGRTTVPCLLIDDGETQEWMYESGDIIRYLKSL
jgi:glutaredoxin